jgi:APA family basic amino acid/polyamine antiporter
MLTIIGIFILRKKRPDAERPYKAPLFPILPGIYVLLAAAFCLLLIFYKQNYVIGGLVIVALGFPLYYIALKNRKNGNHLEDE